MGKKIIVTSGPTIEPIDEVMRITNMATGSLSATITDRLLEIANPGQIDKIYYVHNRMAKMPASHWGIVEYIPVETTDDLLQALTRLLTTEKIDTVIHAAAVGDYKTKYAIRAEDIVGEILNKQAAFGRVLSYDELMKIFDNPWAVQNNSTKISSYEPHLMVMLTLTPKVIGAIKKLSPDTQLIGWKLLDKVSKTELYQVASRLREHNNADFIVANDLSKIDETRHWAMIVGADGVVAECETKQGIAEAIAGLVLTEDD